MFARVADDKYDKAGLVEFLRDLEAAAKIVPVEPPTENALRVATSCLAKSNDSRSVILMISSIIFISALPTGRFWPMPSTR